MKIPGFTAEVALGLTLKRYQVRSYSSSITETKGQAMIIPQQQAGPIDVYICYKGCRAFGGSVKFCALACAGAIIL